MKSRKSCYVYQIQVLVALFYYKKIGTFQHMNIATGEVSFLETVFITWENSCYALSLLGPGHLSLNLKIETFLKVFMIILT